MFLDDQGSWMTMFFTTILSLFIFSHVYNLLLMIGGESTLSYRITEDMGIRNSLFLRMAATGTWCGDFFTAWMVIYFYVEYDIFTLAVFIWYWCEISYACSMRIAPREFYYHPQTKFWEGNVFTGGSGVGNIKCIIGYVTW